jgi:hypothetical protein
MAPSSSPSATTEAPTRSSKDSILPSGRGCSRDWDTPPGTGYLTVAVITISAVLTAIMTLRRPRIVADEAQQSHSDLSSGLVG